MIWSCDLCLIPGLGRSPGEGNANLLQYSCLENSMDRGACQSTVHGVTKSQTQLCLCVYDPALPLLGMYLEKTIVQKHMHPSVHQFSSVAQSCLTLSTPWITARQASLFIINSWSLLKLMPIESMMPSSHLILCRPLLLLPPIPPSIRVFSNESTLRMRWPKY